jgi:tetratricopeptide (TPR) repeat protein
MDIHIDRGGQQDGPYPLEQIKAWLSSGEMSAGTMSSMDGGLSWIPVHCIPDIRNDQSLVRIIRTATSANMEVETKIIDDTLKEIEELMSNTDPAARANIQNRLQWKLRILYKQVYSFKAQFPNALEAQAYEGALYSAQARAQILSVGGWRKSQMRSGNLAWGIVSGLMANQQEKNNVLKALPLFDRALSIFDNAGDRLTKAYLYKELNQPQDALRELNHICANFVDDEAYIAARQFKDEIETP